MTKALETISLIALLAWLLLFALYPIAAITGWQYHLDLGFTIWRQHD